MSISNMKVLPDYHSSSAYPPEEEFFRVDYMGSAAARTAAAEPPVKGLWRPIKSTRNNSGLQSWVSMVIRKFYVVLKFQILWAPWY